MTGPRARASQKILSPVLVILAVASVTVISSRTSQAFSKAQTPSTSAKMIVTLTPVHDVSIAIPAAVGATSPTTAVSTFDFGPDLHSSLCLKLIQTHFILDQPENELCGQSSVASAAGAKTPAAQPSPQASSLPGGTDVWDGSSVVPAATFSFKVDALALRTGDHGDRMFYGFDERTKTPFNDGLGTEPNEFPLTLIQFQQWFDRTFQDRGIPPVDSQSGLDLGQGFNFNAVIAEFGVKYASYNSVIRMHVTMDAPLIGRHEVRPVQVTGSGFFFDVVGGYEEWSGAIGLARTDAMNAAFNNAFAASYAVIDEWSKTLPLTAKVFGFESAQKIFLNTGTNSGIPVGTKYTPPGNPNLVFEVIESVPTSGSIAKLDAGTTAQIQLGMPLVQQLPTPAPSAAPAAAGVGSAASPAPLPSEAIVLPSVNVPESNFAGAGYTISTSGWQGVLDTITGGLAFGYRLWRYFQYDQDYLGPDWDLKIDGVVDLDGKPIPCVQPDGSIGGGGASGQSCYSAKDYAAKDAPSADVPVGADAWAATLKTQPWAKQIGLDVAPAMTNEGPLVAIIDSGVDYNHPALSERI